MAHDNILSVLGADSGLRVGAGNGTTLFCYFWQYPGIAHISTINGSRGLVRMLSRWRPGRPWAGRGSVPGGRFHARLTPGREAERSVECHDNSHDAVGRLRSLEQ
jgi:hypothetical protein